jgi:hypothetical protein
MKLGFKASTSTIPSRPQWWPPEELNLSTPTPLFHSPLIYSQLRGKGTNWCPKLDSNQQISVFEADAFTNLTTRADLGKNDEGTA